MKIKNIILLTLGVSIAWISGPIARAGTLSGGFRGMNWAAYNNSDGSWPYGLSGVTDYNTAVGVGQRIGAAVKNSGGNFVRMPVNASLCQGWNWWIYSGAINGIRQSGCGVILCYWCTGSGTIGNSDAWFTMWDTVNSSYGNDGGVIYEPLNEPYGYSATDLCNLYAYFLQRYSPGYHKCILAGTGYETGVQDIANDSRLSNQLIGLHAYHWYFGSGSSWSTYYNDLNNVVGGNASRVVVTEIGVQTVNNSTAFWQQWNNSEASDAAFLNGALKWARDNDVGTVAWSGVFDDDSYRWFWGNNNLSEVNQDVCDMFRWSWGQHPWYHSGPSTGSTYKIISRNSGKALDAYGAQTGNGTQIIQWTYGGSANQKWTLYTDGNGAWYIQGVQSGKFIDISGSGTSNGTKVQLWDGTGGTNQRFYINGTDSGYYEISPSHATGSCLDVEGVSTADGANVHLWQWGGGANQQWSFQWP
jgi:hypothetical protein